MTMVKKALNLISGVFGAVATLFLAFLMFGITADVLVRTLTGDPIPGVFEMSELSLVMVVFLGAMWAQEDRAHIRVNILSNALLGLPQRLAMVFAWGCGAIALLMLAWPTTQEAIYSVSIWEFRWGYIQVPIWWTKVSLALGLWIAAIQMACHAASALIEDDAEETHSAVEA